MSEKISVMSELLLAKLRDKLVENTEQDSTFIRYELKEIQSDITLNEAKICICYLQDLGYIQNAEIDEENVLKVRLHGSGIKFVEDKKTN